MKAETKRIVQTLKDRGEDYEFYPTTKDMVRAIYNDLKENRHDNSFLDIGCGTCSFKKYWNMICEEEDKEYCGNKLGSNYHVIEKSKYLIDLLDKETIVVGTDLWETTLLDKDEDVVFCNPPYSEYESWLTKILKESNAKYIYMIIPDRWRENESIKEILKKYGYLDANGNKRVSKFSKFVPDTIKSLGKFDFSKADRIARATVEIVCFCMPYTNGNRFDKFFEENFDLDISEKDKRNFETVQELENDLNNKLEKADNKIEMLVKSYSKSLDDLWEAFKGLSKIDGSILKAIGISKGEVKLALKLKIENLKSVYWDAAFNILEPIKSRLTSKSRYEFRERFQSIYKIDFTEKNIYAVIVWVIKNANSYCEQQIIDLYRALSSEKSVKAYKSNKKVFAEGKSRWSSYNYYRGEVNHYTLDYRIVTDARYLPEANSSFHSDNYTIKKNFSCRISDILTVMNNMGFKYTAIQYPKNFGDNGIVIGIVNGKDDELFEFRCYINGNVHFKFNIEIMKALNVVAARILKWIVTPEDIRKEFDDDEMAKGAEKYFNCCKALPLSSAFNYLPYGKEDTDNKIEEKKDENETEIEEIEDIEEQKQDIKQDIEEEYIADEDNEDIEEQKQDIKQDIEEEYIADEDNEEFSNSSNDSEKQMTLFDVI